MTTMALCLTANTMLLAACGGASSTEQTGGAASETPNQETVKQEQSGGEEAVSDLNGKTIEIATYLSGDTLNAYKEVIAGFENETGVKVTLDEYGEDYESTMKTRMASNDLPDIFETHGWSLIRYKEYLTDLSGEPWAGQLNKAALGVI